LFVIAAMVAALGTSTVRAAELVVWSTLSCREALMEIVPAFERATGQTVTIAYAGGAELADRIRGGLGGDLFIGPDEFSGPLIAEGRLAAGTHVTLAHSGIAFAVAAGAPKPDIGTAEKLKAVLLAARSVSYSTGASGVHFLSILTRLGIADAVVAKRVAPRPGELVGAVVARGGAEIGVQQVSELLPVSGIEIVRVLPPEFQLTIVYAATAFPQSTQRDAARAFVEFLYSAEARDVLRRKGLDPS